MQVNFASEAELLAHYKAVRARVNGWKAPRQPKPLPAVIITTGSRKPWLTPVVDGISLAAISPRLPEVPGPIFNQRIVHRIIEVVAAFFNITRNDILSHRREAPVVLARFIAMHLSKQETQRSMPWLGLQFGGRDHTTILHGLRKMKTRIENDPEFAEQVTHIHALVLAV